MMVVYPTAENLNVFIGLPKFRGVDDKSLKGDDGLLVFCGALMPSVILSGIFPAKRSHSVTIYGYSEASA